MSARRAPVRPASIRTIRAWLTPVLPVLATLALATPAVAQDSSAGTAVTGYVDADRDGRNDLFRDANGDGINDVTGRSYPHRFSFVDRDRDGRNDLYVDVDGDGVNDLDARVVDADGDGICDNVLDTDGDGRNDVTGETYGKKEEGLGGWRHGRVDEETGQNAEVFVDQDGDGVNDAWQARGSRAGRNEAEDVFIDEDGDGIADGRSVAGRQDLDLPARGSAGGRGHAGPPSSDGSTRDKEKQGQRRRGTGRGR